LLPHLQSKEAAFPQFGRTRPRIARKPPTDSSEEAIDATIVRAHQHSAGAQKKSEQAIGRSRGGLTTKIHALVDALGNPVELRLTPGQAHDLACAEPLLEGVDTDALLGDKAYDADSLIDTLTQRGITPVIPPKENRKTPRDCDFVLYCERNLIKRSSIKSSIFEPSPHATTSSPKYSWPECSSLRP
jgi:transposase